MSAQAVAVLLFLLTCCGSGLWRYSTNSPNYQIFSTRSTIKLEYEGTLFFKWKVPETCSVKNESSPTTELRCSSPGTHIIKPIVNSHIVEETRHLSVESSNTCFLWHYKVINLPHNLTQVIIVWIYDPENADSNELSEKANKPSLNSVVLSKQLATLGQKPVINTIMKRKVYFPEERMKDGAWYISVPMAADDVLKEIQGNRVPFQDCFIANYVFLLTAPLPTIPEKRGYLPISSPPGSQAMADWDACIYSSAVVVADMETFQTNDSFLTWTRIRVSPQILTDDERHNVSAVKLSQDGIFFLINGVLYIKTFTKFKRLGKKESLPKDGIIGITSRKWCWINYLLKANRRSNIAIWTRNALYLGYPSLTFAKITTTEKLRKFLRISSVSTLTIHNVAYTAHPLELAMLVSHCRKCKVTTKLHLVLYSEDTKRWVHQDFALQTTINNVVISHFLYSAMPDLILWDKHRVYYSYHSFAVTGVIHTLTKSGNLSKLSDGSFIHCVFIDSSGNILVKMENNIMFYFKIYSRDAVRLPVWTNSTTKSLILLNTSGHICLVYVSDNGNVYPQEYPLSLEVQSVALKSKEKCPFTAFHNNIYQSFYILDKGQNLSVWAQLVYPENTGLYLIVESYGPKILERKQQVLYEIVSGYCTKTMTIIFSQNINYEAVDNYFKLQHQNTGIMLVQLRPSDYAKTCAIPPTMFQIAVGCDTNKYIAVKGFNKTSCLLHDFYYIIEKSYLRDQPSENLRVKYNLKKYGCPLRLDFKEKFQPLIQLYDDNGFVEDVEVNFIVWEVHGRADYTFNVSMKKSGCLNEAQTWKSMTNLSKHLPLEEVWGPENYKHCFSYAIGKPGDLNRPYEIMNKSNQNHLVWPMHHTGMYVFQVKVLDPNYSFCNLTAIFAIEIYGVIPSPNGYLVFSLVFLLMQLFFTLLVLSYFHYMRIYRQLTFQTIYNSRRKQKNN